MENKIYKVTMLIILTAFVTFMITAFSMYTYFGNNIQSENATLEKLTEKDNFSDIENNIKRIKSTIDKYYLWNDKIDENELKEGIIKGYVDGLGDQYTEYIPADEMKEYTESITGNFVGIGIYIIADKQTGKIVVYYPMPESPAEKAGIKSGDVIVSVDGIEYTIEDFETIANKIKGEEGTTVNIVIERNGEKMNFDIVRAKIGITTVATSMLENSTGYIKMSSFDEDTAESFKAKVEELQNQGAKSLIIDIRNNGGGILNVATDIADYFLDKKKTIISTVDNKGMKETIYSENEPIFNMPIAILVNENSASASEILACSLQDNNRGTIIGKTTYGKGIIQVLLSLSDGSGLKITTEEYYTPNGVQINEKGVTPDIEVELPNTLNNIYSIEIEQDTQLKKAIEVLNKGE